MSKRAEIDYIKLDDIPYIANIIEKQWHLSQEESRQLAEEYLANNQTAAAFCAHVEDKIIGMGLFALKMDDVSSKYGPWVCLLWVDPEYRGNHIGIEITRHRMEHARRYGYKKLYLDTRQAVPYHRRLGWKEIETIIYDGEPDTIMEYDLTKNFPII